ncbi:MAG: hypothetical protein OEY81_03960, partial [Candidatus Bathyarchaeota archaeon]|nr:hypothetical protein [Candidatus Bathyarchaeota archaeon]
MADPKFFLDTGALIALAGLEGSNLQLFKKHIEESNSKLSITHIQVNEKHRRELQDYQRRIDKALESLTNKGIVVQIEPTKIALFDVSRFDLAKFSDEETGKLCDKLRKEIDQCEKVK